jgi:hypothetical protein
MLSVLVSIFILSSLHVQDSNRHAEWRTVADSSHHLSFDCPVEASIESKRFSDDPYLVLRVFCADSLYPSFGNLFGKKTILFAEFNCTKLSFPDAAADWGLTHDRKHYFIYANPGLGPSNRLRLVESRKSITLKGHQSIGQNSSEGYMEIASVPFAFVFVKGQRQRNVVMQVWYDSTASSTLDRIIQSFRVIEE